MANNSAVAANDEGHVINVMSFHLASDDDEGDEGDVEVGIPRVPKSLREVNEEAYTPQLISIGPYHHGREELADMVKHKRRFSRAFYLRINQNKRKDFISYIGSQEKTIRRQYSKNSSLSSSRFKMMILSDAIFIMELFLTYYLKDRSDTLLEEAGLEALRRDLQLLENQLPYFVLEELYNLASVGNDEESFPPFRNLSCHFFLLDSLHNIRPLDETIIVKHFTDLCRQALVGTWSTDEVRPIKKALPSAVQLRKSGVNFKGLSNSERYLVDITLEKRTAIIPFFNKVELQIPPIHIMGHTESLIRNMMALEQRDYRPKAYICSYIELMQFLIKNEEDVDYLVGEGIISNYVHSESEIVDMFNKLRQKVPPSSSCYSSICIDLRYQHNKRARILGLGIKIAATFSVLSLIQTVCSILQVILRK